MDIWFFLKSILLGVGLAMDACAVSMANGLRESQIKFKKTLIISVLFGLFQGFMPLIGYTFGHLFLQYIEKFIPIIALLLLGYLGSKMIIDSIKNKGNEEVELKTITSKVILIQSIATSIDALSVGLTFADYRFIKAFITSIIISLVTAIICVIAHLIGKKWGTALGHKAEIVGGAILIVIGLEIFITGII